MHAPSPLTPFAPLPHGRGVGGGGFTEDKQHLRQLMKLRMQSMTPEERTAESQALCQIILEQVTPGTRTVCAYAALPDEPDLSAAIQEMLNRGIHMFLPRITNDRMTFHRIHSLEELQPGSHGILEPRDDTPALEDGTADLVLVPGRAFDQSGNRLGRGKGHYDRWISQQRSRNAETQFWGVAFACQIVERLLSEPHDQQLDAVLSRLPNADGDA